MDATRDLIQFRVRVPFSIEREGRLFVASCQALDVVSQGETQEEATANLSEAIRLFIETAYTMGTLDEVLRGRGFIPTGAIDTPPQANLLDVPLHLLAARKHGQDHACSL